MKETDYYNLMKDFETEEIEPMVGIFWYLPEEHRLFEVYASSLSQSKMVNGRTTYHKLHITTSFIKQYGKPRNAETEPEEKKNPFIIKIIPNCQEAGYFMTMENLS